MSLSTASSTLRLRFRFFQASSVLQRQMRRLNRVSALALSFAFPFPFSFVLSERNVSLCAHLYCALGSYGISCLPPLLSLAALPKRLGSLVPGSLHKEGARSALSSPRFNKSVLDFGPQRFFWPDTPNPNPKPRTLNPKTPNP